MAEVVLRMPTNGEARKEPTVKVSAAKSDVERSDGVEHEVQHEEGQRDHGGQLDNPDHRTPGPRGQAVRGSLLGRTHRHRRCGGDGLRALPVTGDPVLHLYIGHGSPSFGSHDPEAL